MFIQMYAPDSIFSSLSVWLFAVPSYTNVFVNTTDSGTKSALNLAPLLELPPPLIGVDLTPLVVTSRKMVGERRSMMVETRTMGLGI